MDDNSSDLSVRDKSKHKEFSHRESDILLLEAISYKEEKVFKKLK